MVELVVSGTRLCGRIVDTSGRPITSAKLYERGLIPMDIQPDGSYLTEIMQPGAYSISCMAPGYRQTERTVAVRQGLIELCDFTLEPSPVYTGRVLDYGTKRPIAGVLVATDENLEGFPVRTAADGLFRAQLNSWRAAFTLSHPEYATTTCVFAENNPAVTNVEVFMSTDTRLKVHVDGIPPTFTKPLSVRLQSCSTFSRTRWSGMPMPGDPDMQACPVVDGVAEFTQIPPGKSPWLVMLCSGGGNNQQMPLGLSKQLDIEPGTTMETHMAMPAFGALAVTLSIPYNQRIHYIEGTGVPSGEGSEQEMFAVVSTYVGCDVNGRRLLWSCLVTNTYQLRFCTEGFNLATNITIAANQTAEWWIDVPTNTVRDGVIRGTVKLADGLPVNGNVLVGLPDSYNPSYGQVRDGAFMVGGLNPASNYEVTVQIESYNGTNLTASGVKPNGPPLEFVMDGACRVTGSVVDRDGNPLPFSLGASPWSSSYQQQIGELLLYPVFPGTHTIWITARGYAPCKVEARVVSSDVDLGNIVVIDKGCKLSGRLLNEQGAPVANTDIWLHGRESDFGRSGKTDADGRFVFENIIRDVPFSLGVSGYLETPELEPLTQDKDLGDMTQR